MDQGLFLDRELLFRFESLRFPGLARQLLTMFGYFPEPSESLYNWRILNTCGNDGFVARVNGADFRIVFSNLPGWTNMKFMLLNTMVKV